MGFTKEQRDITNKYYYKTHPLHYYNRGIILGSKKCAYYKDEMMYGRLNLKYDIKDFTEEELKNPKKEKNDGLF